MCLFASLQPDHQPPARSLAEQVCRIEEDDANNLSMKLGASSISLSDRTELVDWMLLVAVRYQYPLHAFSLACEILDRYCDIKLSGMTKLPGLILKRSNFQLVGLMALRIATQVIDDEYEMTVQDVVFLCCKSFSKQDIARAHADMLFTLDWRVNTRTPFDDTVELLCTLDFLPYVERKKMRFVSMFLMHRAVLVKPIPRSWGTIRPALGCLCATIHLIETKKRGKSVTLHESASILRSMFANGEICFERATFREQVRALEIAREETTESLVRNAYALFSWREKREDRELNAIDFWDSFERFYRRNTRTELKDLRCIAKRITTHDIDGNLLSCFEC